jgi:hypothetical protein
MTKIEKQIKEAAKAHSLTAKKSKATGKWIITNTASSKDIPGYEDEPLIYTWAWDWEFPDEQQALTWLSQDAQEVKAIICREAVRAGWGQAGVDKFNECLQKGVQ